MAHIKSVTTTEPKYKYSTEEVIETLNRVWLNSFSDSERQKAIKIFRAAQIDYRHSIAPFEVLFDDLSFEERNNIYMKEVIDLGVDVFDKALTVSSVAPEDIDVLITMSCTGFMIPSACTFIAERMNLKTDVVRLPVTEMACAGGVTGLIYAYHFVKANPSKTIALLCLETPSITFQRDDHSMTNVVATALFGDGASCILLDDKGIGLKIRDVDMYHFNDTTDLLGYNLSNSGFQLVLDKTVPGRISENFQAFVSNILGRNQMTIEEIDHFMIHPGGKKIINVVEDLLSNYGKNLEISREVLNRRGNMSSATIHYILEATLNKKFQPGDYGYMLAFGPGISAQSLLLEAA